MALTIDFLANVSKFLKGTGDAESALEDVGGSLDALARTATGQADATGNAIRDGVQDGTGKAEASIHGLSSKLDGLGDTTGGDRAGDAIRDGVQDGTSKAEESVGSLSSKVDTLASTDAGDRAGDAIRDGVQDGTSKAESDVDSLQSKFATLASASKASSAEIGGGISSSVHKGTEEANEGVKTLKENTGSNLKEVAASFDGSFSSIAGGAQGLIAEIAEGFGPVGLIAGAVAAGGIGLITSGIEGAQEKTDEFKQHVSDLTGELIDSGTKGKRSLGGIQDTIKDLATAQDGVNLSQIWDDAKNAGLDYKGVVAAYVSGNADQLKTEADNVGKVADKYDSQLRSAQGSANGQQTLLGNLVGKQLESAQKIEGGLRDQQKAAEDAAKAQEAAAKAGLTEFALKKGAIDQVHDAYKDAAGEVDDYIDKESGLFDVSKYIKAMERRQQALEDYQETLATSKLSPEAKAYIESLGADQAALLVSGYADANKEQKAKLNNIWTANGTSNASSYKEALGDDLSGAKVRGPEIILRKPDVPSIVTDIQGYLDDRPLFFKTQVAPPSSIARKNY